MKSLLLCGIFLLGFSTSCKQSNTVDDKSNKNENEVEIKVEDEQKNDKTILFFGNSLTAGYGLDTSEAFPALIGKKLDSLGLDYQVINAGNSGETTSGGLNRIDWILNQDVDIFVLELGANDGLRGIPISETRSNLQAIIDKVRKKNADIKIILAGMQLPPNMGKDYSNAFKSIFPDLADKNNIDLIPFLLEGVGGIPSLNLPDGIHPTAEGHKILAQNVWDALEQNIELSLDGINR